jgi:hypothetical protein
MKTIEVLIVESQTRFNDQLLSTIIAQHEKVLNNDVYRYEIDFNLDCLFYNLDLENSQSLSLVNHLKPHISALLILSDSSFMKGNDNKDVIDSVTKEFGGIPVVCGVNVPPDYLEELDPQIKNNGLYLSEQGRLCFWNENDHRSMLNLFEMLLTKLPLVEEIPQEV